MVCWSEKNLRRFWFPSPVMENWQWNSVRWSWPRRHYNKEDKSHPNKPLSLCCFIGQLSQRTKVRIPTARCGKQLIDGGVRNFKCNEPWCLFFRTDYAPNTPGQKSCEVLPKALYLPTGNLSVKIRPAHLELSELPKKGILTIIDTRLAKPSNMKTISVTDKSDWQVAVLEQCPVSTFDYDGWLAFCLQPTIFTRRWKRYRKAGLCYLFSTVIRTSSKACNGRWEVTTNMTCHVCKKGFD